MTPKQALWAVMGMAVVMLAASIYLVRENLSLRESLSQGRAIDVQIVVTQREACERANLRRAQDRYTLRILSEIADTLGDSSITDASDTDYFHDIAQELRARVGDETLKPIDCFERYPLPSNP